MSLDMDYELISSMYKQIKPKYAPKGEIRLVKGTELQNLLEKTHPILYTHQEIGGAVGIPTHVYYRAYKMKGDGYAVFYLFEWNQQVIPPHKYDYEPVIVLTDSNMNPREVYTDRFHYFINKTHVNGKYYLYTGTPWRSMEVKRRTKPEWVPVYDVGRIGPPLEYLSDIKLSQLKAREENPLKIHDKLIRDPFSIRGAEHWETYHTPSLTEFLQDIQANYKFLGLKRIGYELYATLVKTGELIKSLVTRGKTLLSKQVVSKGIKKSTIKVQKVSGF